MIVIVDYGLGNLGSILNMYRKIGKEAVISGDINVIAGADKLILPGVGAFDTGMNNLKERNLIQVLNKKVMHDRVPILGICLGMQLMTRKSEEGQLEGLGWMDAETVKFDFSNSEKKYKVPHMGWKYISIKKEHPLMHDGIENPKFYFVHSYYVKCNRLEDILSTSEYEHEFVSSFARDNIMGVQFHPEKSHRYGMHLLKNFEERL